MLGSTPPGYQTTSLNKQAMQPQFAFPGAQMPSGFGVFGGKFPNYGTSQFSVPSSYATPSSFDSPQQQQPPSPPTMNPYTKSSNLSTLLRVLLGRT